jgi:hypothetical protein
MCIKHVDGRRYAGTWRLALPQGNTAYSRRGVVKAACRWLCFLICRLVGIDQFGGGDYSYLPALAVTFTAGGRTRIIERVSPLLGTALGAVEEFINLCGIRVTRGAVGGERSIGSSRFAMHRDPARRCAHRRCKRRTDSPSQDSAWHREPTWQECRRPFRRRVWVQPPP